MQPQAASKGIAIEVAGNRFTIRAAGGQEFSISAQRVGDGVLVAQALGAAVPSAVNADAAAFDRLLLIRDVFRFHGSIQGHDFSSAVRPLNIGLSGAWQKQVLAAGRLNLPRGLIEASRWRGDGSDRAGP